jgi:hypothetical protein
MQEGSPPSLSAFISPAAQKSRWLFFRLQKSGACATPPHYRSGGGTEWAFPDL